MAATQAGRLSAEQIEQVVGQTEQISTAATRAINSNDFVFFAAFDGTKNNYLDPTSILPGEQSTNVSQLFHQVEAANASQSNLAPKYYAGPGSAESLPGSAAIPAQVTREAISVGARAYKDFQDAALSWLEKNPGFDPDNIKIAATSFSRGVDAAAVFSHLLYEKGLVDDDGKVLIPPGQLGFSAAVIFDPVATGMQGNVAFSPASQNTVVVQAQNEYRYPFKAVDYSQQEQTTTVSVTGNHGDIGGSYDNGIAALTLMNSTAFFQKSGLSIADVADDRRFDANAPVIVHNEAVDTFGNKVWDSYGQYGVYDGPRLTVAMATPATVQESSDGKTITFTDFANRKVTYEEEYGPGSTTTSLSIETLDDWRIKTITSSDQWQTTKVEFDTASPPLEVTTSDEGETSADSIPSNDDSSPEVTDQSSQGDSSNDSAFASNSGDSVDTADDQQSGSDTGLPSDDNSSDSPLPSDDNSSYLPPPSDEYGSNTETGLSREDEIWQMVQSQRLLESTDGDEGWSHFARTTSLKEDGSLEVRTEYLDYDGRVAQVKLHTLDTDGTSRGDYWDVNGDGQWEMVKTSRQDASGGTHSVYSGYDPESHTLRLRLEAGPGDDVSFDERYGGVDANFADGSGAAIYSYYGNWYVGYVTVKSDYNISYEASFGLNQTLSRSESGEMQIVSNDPAEDKTIILDPAGRMVTLYNMNRPSGEGETEDRYIHEEYVDEQGTQWTQTQFFDQQGERQRIVAQSKSLDGSTTDLVDSNGDQQWDEVKSRTYRADGYTNYAESAYDPQTHALQHEYSDTNTGRVETVSEDLDGNGVPDYTWIYERDPGEYSYGSQFTRTEFHEDGSVASKLHHEMHEGQPEVEYLDANGDGKWDRQITTSRPAEYTRVVEEFDYNADGSVGRHTLEEAKGGDTKRFVDSDGNGAWDERTDTMRIDVRPYYYGDWELKVVQHFDETGQLLDVREDLRDEYGTKGYRIDANADGRWDEVAPNFPYSVVPAWQKDQQDVDPTSDRSDPYSSGTDANAEIDRQVNALIEAMAGFAPTPAGQSSPLPEPQAPLELMLAVDGR